MFGSYLDYSFDKSKEKCMQRLINLRLLFPGEIPVGEPAGRPKNNHWLEKYQP